MRLASLVLDFALLFNLLFDAPVELALRLLSAALRSYPHTHLGHGGLVAVSILFSLVAPVAVAALFVFKAKIHARSTSRAGWILMAVAVAICLFRLLALYAATFVQGGGAMFVMAYLLAYLDLPLRLLLVIGAVKVLIAMKPAGCEAQA